LGVSDDNADLKALFLGGSLHSVFSSEQPTSATCSSKAFPVKPQAIGSSAPQFQDKTAPRCQHQRQPRPNRSGRRSARSRGAGGARSPALPSWGLQPAQPPRRRPQRCPPQRGGRAGPGRAPGRRSSQHKEAEPQDKPTGPRG